MINQDQPDQIRSFKINHYPRSTKIDQYQTRLTKAKTFSLDQAISTMIYQYHP